MDAHAVQHVDGLRAVAQLGHRGLRGDGGRQCLEALRRHGVVGRGAGGALEDATPGAQQLLGIVVPVRGGAGQGLGEEGAQRGLRGGREEIGLQRHLGLGELGGRLAVAPARQAAHRHLVKGDGGGEALGVQVPALLGAQAQEGVEVGGGAGLEVVRRRAGEREVEQHQRQAAAAVAGDADVVGLDVTVHHRVLLEQAHGVEQLLAPALQHVQRQATGCLDALGKGFVAGTLEQQRGAPGHGGAATQLHDVGVAQLAQGLGLGLQVVVVGGIHRDLEHQLFVAAVRAHQQRVAGRAAAQALDDGVATLDAVTAVGLAGVDRGFGVGRGELVLHRVELLDELLHRAVAAQHVGAGGELHQLLQGRRAAVHGVGQAQALAEAQALVQLQRGAGRGLGGEDQPGQAAQREDVHLRAMGGVGAGGLGGQVDQARVLDVGLHVQRAGGAVLGGPGAGTVGVARGGLPVHQLHARGGGLDVAHQHALRPERAVEEAARVGVLEHLGNAAHQQQALAGVQALAVVTHQVVQAHGAGVEVEDQRRAELAVLVLAAAQDAAVVDALQHLELTLGPAHQVLACFGAGGVGQVVDAHAPLHVDADVAGLPLLEAVAVGDELVQPVVAHLAVLVGRAHAGLDQPLAEGLDGGGIQRRGVDLAARAIGEGGDDAVIVGVVRAAAQEHAAAGVALQPAGHRGGGQEHQRREEGQAHLGLDHRTLTLHQAGQPLALAVGEQQWVVDRAVATVGGPGPGVRVAADHARARLDLHHEEACRREHQRVHLIDPAFVVNELEVGPDVPGLAVGQLGTQPLQRLPLPREAGLRDDVPAVGAEGHDEISLPAALASPASAVYSNKSPTPQPNNRHNASTSGNSTRVARPSISALTVLRFRPVARATSAMRSCSRAIRRPRWHWIINGPPGRLASGSG